jgi:anti-sigma factor RsiW
MTCQFTERISQLVDGELAPADAGQARRHLAACALCRQAEADYLALRAEIQAADSAPDPAPARTPLRGSRRAPIWRREVALPAPVLALLLVALAALGVRSVRPPQAPDNAAAPPQRVRREPPPASDFSRFDRGARALIYKARRAESESR